MFNVIKSKLQHFMLACCFLVAGAVATSQAALATSPGATAATAITAAEAQVELVIGAMVGVLVILVAWTLIRKAFGK
jgi:thioredoxin-like negative regulator of GroEL